MLSWLCSVWNEIIFPKNFPDNFFSFVGMIISLIGISIAIKAATAVNEFRKKQSDSVWNFHTNLITFLKRLKLTIGSDMKHPSPFLSYFYSKNDKLNNSDSYQIEMLRNLANEFLHYLSTANGQIPLSMNQDEFQKWKDKREKLTGFLNSALYLGERLDYGEEDFKNTLTEIHSIIKCLTTNAENVMNGILKDNPIKSKKRRCSNFCGLKEE